MRNRRKHNLHTRRLRHQGFTLIEMLVCILILSIGLVLMLQAFQASAMALAESRDAIRASTLLRENLAGEVDHTGQGRSEGRFDSPYAAYRWSIEKNDAVFGDQQILIVTASVWLDGSQSRYEITTLQPSVVSQK